jgi:hypothetical protein
MRGIPGGAGHRVLLDNQINTTNGTVQLKARFDNAEHKLWPGQYVNARLQMNSHGNALTVPAAAIQRNQQGTYVYAISQDDKANMQPVKVDRIQDGVAVLGADSGLTPDQRVVIDGQYKLKPGSRIVKASCSRPRVLQLRLRNAGRKAPSERLRRLHQAPHRHHAAGHRHPAGGHRGMAAAAGSALAAGRFPDHPGHRALAGSQPETMASNVAQPLERQFSLIAGLSQMTSQSTLGSTQITLQFDLNRNIDAAALDVQAAINASRQLPANLPNPPTFRKINPADSPIMIMSVQSDALPLTVVNDYADNILAQQISQISGVGLVT